MCDERGELNSGQEIPAELVISCGDAAQVIEPAKAASDDISASVDAFVEAMNDDTVGFIGMTGLAPRPAISARRLSPCYPLVCEKRAQGGASARTSGAAAMSAS